MYNSYYSNKIEDNLSNGSRSLSGSKVSVVSFSKPHNFIPND